MLHLWNIFFLQFGNNSLPGNGQAKSLNIYVSALGNCARSKKKYLQGNNMAFINETLLKGGTKITRLRNTLRN